jgi:phosphoribosyl-dephospho-CoA transferase
MGRAVMDDLPAPTHDLILLREPSALAADVPVPPWVGPALRRTPWVVVRRGHVRDGLIPVGVRGMARSQRFAALLAASEVVERLSPEDLVVRCLLIGEEREAAAPALAALSRVGPILAHRGYRWGPGGSVGFEVATGVPTASASSDLDLILRRDRPIGPGEAIDLQAALAEAAAPARVDAMLETPLGGVSLADLATMPALVLVRTPDGARLSADPWLDVAAAMREGCHDGRFPVPGAGRPARGHAASPPPARRG